MIAERRTSQAGAVGVAAPPPTKRLAAQTDPFPKMPLASELTKKRDNFMSRLENMHGVAFTPSHFKQTLAPLEPAEGFFASADTRVFIRCRPILPDEDDRVPVVTKAQGYRDVILLTPKTTFSGECSVAAHPMPVDATF